MRFPVYHQGMIAESAVHVVIPRRLMIGEKDALIAGAQLCGYQGHPGLGRCEGISSKGLQVSHSVGQTTGGLMLGSVLAWALEMFRDGRDRLMTVGLRVERLSID